MGDVVVTVKVHVENPDNIDNVLGAIKEKLQVSDSAIEELGFGIKVLKVAVMSSDAEGSPDVEGIISSIDGVSSVEVESVTRV
ncbi:MAG: elongation factor 1-beta [Methanobacteriota archaeon]|nr:MAG: elongation factor 1-beta [Euryarchaeota archaeon]